MEKRWLLVIIITLITIITLYHLTPFVAASCGDGACSASETCETCYADCGTCNLGHACNSNAQCTSNICRCGVCASSAFTWPDCQCTAECGAGYTCESGTCYSTCEDECPWKDATNCSGTQVVTCGNYDDDTCLEWGPPADCPSNETCQGESCTATCSNECEYDGLHECYNSSTTATCGDYNGDGCLEWKTQTCPSGVCTGNGECKENCANPYFSASSKPTYASLFNQFYCEASGGSDQYCYGCNAGYTYDGTSCVCADQDPPHESCTSGQRCNNDTIQSCTTEP